CYRRLDNRRGPKILHVLAFFTPLRLYRSARCDPAIISQWSHALFERGVVQRGGSNPAAQQSKTNHR
ncbi:hypothetical protein L0337_32750, partial [candidate division KSB1 bacterium]|nr:hypothetical protein [candidate division KSB1 bacterium]